MKLARIQFFAIIMLVSYLLSACGAATPAPANVDTQPGGDGQSVQVEFAGTIDSIKGDSWTIGGKTVKVDALTVVDGTFSAGDQIKVSATVNADGSVVAGQIESFDSAQATAAISQLNETPDPSSTPDPSTLETPEPTTVAQVSQEFTGTVQSIDGSTVVVDGITFIVTDVTEFQDTINAGDFVKLHAVQNADGTYTLVEIGVIPPTLSAGSNNNASPTSVSSGSGNHTGGNSGSDDGSNGNGSNDGGDDDSGDDGGDD